MRSTTRRDAAFLPSSGCVTGITGRSTRHVAVGRINGQHAPAVAATGTAPDAPRPRRDPRIPSPGTLITKAYKGRELRVVVRDDGLELDGTMYATATALAKAVTGSKSINGNLFLGITKRKRH